MSKILKGAEVSAAPKNSITLILSKQKIVQIPNFELQFSIFSKLFTSYFELKFSKFSELFKKIDVFCTKMQKNADFAALKCI